MRVSRKELNWVTAGLHQCTGYSVSGFSCFIGGVGLGVAGCRGREIEVGVGFEGYGT